MSDTPPPPSPQTKRDRHRFGPGSKRILVLDGSGVRGSAHRRLAGVHGGAIHRASRSRCRLGDHFELIDGTSTGAVVACALALGYSVAEIKKFYFELAPYAFKRQRWHILILQAKFDARGLRQQLDDVVGNRTLETPDLITGFVLAAKRMDTGSSKREMRRYAQSGFVLPKLIRYGSIFLSTNSRQPTRRQIKEPLVRPALLLSYVDRFVSCPLLHHSII